MKLPESQDASERKIKVLLVDDEKSFVEVLHKRLSKRNMDVTRVSVERKAFKPFAKWIMMLRF